MKCIKCGRFMKLAYRDEGIERWDCVGRYHNAVIRRLEKK